MVTSSRSERALLQWILDAAEELGPALGGVSLASFRTDPRRRAVVGYWLIQLGEPCRELLPRLHQAERQAPAAFVRAARVRNHLAHEPMPEVRWDRAYAQATRWLPSLTAAATRLLGAR